MENATSVFSSSLLGYQNYNYIFNRFKLDSVAANSSEIFTLNLTTIKGSLTTVKIECESTNYDLFILPFETAKENSIMNIYAKKQIDKLSIDENLLAFWTKYAMFDIQRQESINVEKTLYAKIFNNSAVPTGEIFLEVVYLVYQ